MVSNTSILFMGIALLISIAIPIGLTIYICRVKKASAIAVLVGALVFFIFQLVTRIPLLNMLATQEWYTNAMSNVWVYILFLSITAGIFEEVGRYVGFKHLLKNKLDWKNGVAFGIGHGGIEAIFLLGLANVNNLIYSFMINAGTYDSTFSGLFPPGVAENVKQQLINTNPASFLAGGVERILTIVVHIALSLVVLMAVKKNNFKYVLYAILLHGFTNASLVGLMQWNWNIWLVEGILGIYAIVAFSFIKKSEAIIDSIDDNVIQS